jgi:hypothetical protein
MSKLLTREELESLTVAWDREPPGVWCNREKRLAAIETSLHYIAESQRLAAVVERVESKLQWISEHASCDYPHSKDDAVDVTCYEWTWGFIVTKGDHPSFSEAVDYEMAKTQEQRQAEQQWVKRTFFPVQAALKTE